ncbi:hypothetical protein I302_102157 [Kwoniella bestiolae CBS 10118]|uniref:Uncharacterized protein n=1 Tax=Kwoniella bestiolae CBS 10118 TaxID=1296100 RepID=A0A1B9GE95_9TREE|nr:hypothetical protein I302_00846 [Kwoniella bestiolae CBS 10118]OCF29344.1 hypothetical protein I302_00846 [Kwoniella bestiolae CBS 10118]
MTRKHVRAPLANNDNPDPPHLNFDQDTDGPTHYNESAKPPSPTISHDEYTFGAASESHNEDPPPYDVTFGDNVDPMTSEVMMGLRSRGISMDLGEETQPTAIPVILPAHASAAPAAPFVPVLAPQEATPPGENAEDSMGIGKIVEVIEK